MNREELKRFLNEEDHLKMKYGFTNHLKSKHINEYLDIIETTQHLSNKTIFGERVFHIRNNLTERPKCKLCEKELKYDNGGYRTFCSVKCSANDTSVRDKFKQTCLKDYGADHPAQSKKVQEKTKQTNLERHGVEYPFQNKEIREKSKQTNLEKHGVEYPAQNKEIKKKQEESNIKIYGTRFPMQNKEVQEKTKQTNLKRRGVEYTFQDTRVREKAKKTMVENHGVENYFHSEKYKKKKQDDQIISINKYLSSIDLEIIDEYTKSNEYNNFRCLKCGKAFPSNWTNIQQGKKCPYCSTTYLNSNEEIEVYKFINSISQDIEIIQNENNIIRNPNTNYPLELDIYIPEKKIAIEFNGLYWHTEDHIGKNHHLLKTNLCREKGIRLIHIFEDEWLDKRDIVELKLKQILNPSCNISKEYIIKPIDSKDKNNFLKEFDIQGENNSDINIGCFYNDQLISIMALTKEYNLNYNIDRICFNGDNYSIDLIKDMLDYFKSTYIWDEIYLTIDLRWEDEKIYEELGFIFVEHVNINFWKVQQIKRVSKNKLIDDCLKIYDCGGLKYKMINL